jgi:oxygen tolerance protein BatD
MSRRLAFALSATAALAAPVAPLYAQTPIAPAISLSVDADRIEVGESVTVTLSASVETSERLEAESPQLAAPPGWRVGGPSISMPTERIVINGRVTARSRFFATWRATPSRDGAFVLGPGSFVLNGRKFTTGTQRVTVYPPGKNPAGPRRSQPPGGRPPQFGSPFPNWPAFPDFNDFFRDRTPPPPPAHDPQLSLEAPPEPQAFLRAVVDKSEAVLGEQVTLSIYLYAQPRLYQFHDPHEPSAPDFVQRPLVTHESDPRPVSVGGATWYAQLVRKLALFPLHTGELTVSPMSLTLLGQGLRGGGLRGGLVRSSKPISVVVTEPPRDGRPPNYRPGDVGTFSLSASVEPRRVPAGGDIAVSVTVQGTGLLPSALPMPERKGLDWYEPEVRDASEANETSVTGSRTFVYVGKLSEPGTLDLGTLAFPYWQPTSRAYEVTRAELGTVEVTGTAAEPSAPASHDPLAAIAPARGVPTGPARPARPLTDAPWFWALIAVAPASVLAAEGLSRALRGARERGRTRDASAARQAELALREADDALAKGSPKDAAAAVERAAALAVEDATGVKVRALLRREIAPALERAGVEAAVASELVELLQACDALRFLPDAGDGAGRDLVARARAVFKRLPRKGRASP